MCVYEKLYWINNLSWIKGTKGNRETVSYRWAICAFWGRAEDRHLGIHLWKEGMNVSAYDCSLPRMDTYRAGPFFLSKSEQRAQTVKGLIYSEPLKLPVNPKCVGKGIRDQIIKDLWPHSACSSFVKQALEEPWKGVMSFVLKNYTLDILFIFAFSILFNPYSLQASHWLSVKVMLELTLCVTLSIVCVSDSPSSRVL